MQAKPYLKPLKQAVKEAGSQAALAERIGCSQQAISDLITGQRGISAEFAVKVSAATGIPLMRLRPDIFKGAA